MAHRNMHHGETRGAAGRDSPVMGLAGGLARRQAWLSMARAGLIWGGLLAGCVFLVLLARDIWWPGAGVWPIGLAMAGLCAAGAAWQVAHPHLAAQSLLVLADRQVGGGEQLSTAYELMERNATHPFLSLLLARCEPLARQVNGRRLLPFAPGRAAWGFGVFALTAMAVYLVAPQQFIPGGLEGEARATVAEQGRHLEELAAQLEAIALRQGYELAWGMAGEIRAAGNRFRRAGLSLEEALAQLEELADTAGMLAGEPPPGAPKPTAPAEEPGGPLADALQRPARIAMDEHVAPAARNETPGSSATSSASAPVEQQTPGADRIDVTTYRPVTQNMETTGVFFEYQSISVNPEEGALLRLTEQDLQLAAQEINRQIASAAGTALPSEPQDNASGEVAGEDAPDGSETRPSNAESATGDTRAGIPGRYDGMDETHSQTSGAPVPINPVEKAGYVDERIVSEPVGGKAETVWLVPEARTDSRRTHALAFATDFQRTPVAVEGGAEIPREYWPVLKGYFDRMGQSGQGR